MKFKAYKMYFEADTLDEVESMIAQHEIDDDVVTHLYFDNAPEQIALKLVSTSCDPTLVYIITQS